MKTFEEIKLEILKIGEIMNACSGQFERAKESSTIDELMQVIKDNFSWCYNNGITTIDILDAIGESKVNQFGIYYKGEVEKLENLKGLYFIGSFKVKYLCNSQVSEMWGNSQVSVMRGNSQVSVMWDNSQVSEMWDNSQVSEMRYNSQVSVMRGNSQVSVMWDNSQVSVMRGNSQVSVMWDNSQVSEMWGNSQISEMRGNSQISEMWGNSQISEMWGNSFARSYNSNLPTKTQDNYCYMDLKNKIVYIGENLTLAK